MSGISTLRHYLGKYRSFITVVVREFLNDHFQLVYLQLIYLNSDFIIKYRNIIQQNYIVVVLIIQMISRLVTAI